MAKKAKRDQLGFAGLVSAILRNVAQQRSLKKARERRAEKLERRSKPEIRAEERRLAKERKKAKPKDTRTTEQIGTEVDRTRDRLDGTIVALRHDLDVPARTRDLRDDLAAKIPREVRGEPRATVIAAGVLLSGWAAVIGGAVLGARTRR